MLIKTRISLNGLIEAKRENPAPYGVDWYLYSLAKAVEREYAKRRGIFHEVNNPDGLTELTPHLKCAYSWGNGQYYEVRADGRVHRMMRYQYAYLTGPADEGIVTHDEWWDTPNNFFNDAVGAIKELAFGTKYHFFNKDLVEEIKDIASTISVEV